MHKIFDKIFGLILEFAVILQDDYGTQRRRDAVILQDDFGTQRRGDAEFLQDVLRRRGAEIYTNGSSLGEGPFFLFTRKHTRVLLLPADLISYLLNNKYGCVYLIVQTKKFW